MDKIAEQIIGYGLFLLPAVALLIAGLIRGWFRLEPKFCHTPLWGRQVVTLLGLLLIVLGGYVAAAVAGAVAVGVGKGGIPAGAEITGTALIVANIIAQVGALIAEVAFGLILLGRLFPLLVIGAGDRPEVVTAGRAIGSDVVPPPLPLSMPGIRPAWEQPDEGSGFPLALPVTPVASPERPPIDYRTPGVQLALPAAALLPPKRWPWGVMLLTLPAAWAMNVLTQAFLSLTGQETGQEHEMVKALRDQPSALWLVALSAVVLAPLTEEFLFRGLMQSSLRGWVGRWGAVALASAMFMLVHPMFSWPAIFVLGLLLGIIYERSGNLIAPMMVHATFNGVTVLITALATLIPTTAPTTGPTAVALALLHAWPLFH